MEKIFFEPIGHVATQQSDVPRFYTVSDVEGELVINKSLQAGLSDIEVPSEIVVLFYFHLSRKFSADDLQVIPPSRQDLRGVFSTRSPVRPNPIGLSKLTVTSVRGNRIGVRGLDMLDGTPILDIKPVK